MIWKWQCNFCKTILDDARTVMSHIAKEHRQCLLYATPIAIDELPVVKRKVGRPPAPKPKPIEAVKRTVDKAIGTMDSVSKGIDKGLGLEEDDEGDLTL